IGRERWPLFAVMRDSRTLRALEATFGQLVLTDDLVDAIVLRSLGLAAAPIVGLSELDDAGIARLSTYFGVEGPAAEESATSCSAAQTVTVNQYGTQRFGQQLLSGFQDYGVVSLTIATWSPTSPQGGELVAVKTATAYLSNLARFRGLAIVDINEWTPRH